MGKEYDDKGKLIFEGKYLNNERHGKGKEYYNNGQLKFEGEYKNNRKWEGKGYNISNNIVFELKNRNGKLKSIIRTQKFYLKVNIYMEKEKEKGKFTIMVN